MADNNRGYSAAAVVLSFFIGGLAGAGLAILMAPSSGKETREKIREWADTAREQSTDLSGVLRQRASGLAEKGKEYLEQKKRILSTAIEAGKEAMEKEKAKLTAGTPETITPEE